MTPHDDAPAAGRVMTDVPAERGRDELRERATKLAQGYLNYPQSVMLRDAIVALFDDLLAQREVPTAGDIDSLDAAMKALHDQLYAEGREGDALIVERAAYAIEALEVDRALRAAPAEATEASGEMAGWLEVAEPCTDPFHFRLDGPTGAQQCPRCGSRMKVAPASGADAAVREAPPISDTEVARIIEAVEAHCGMGHGAWDMVAARDLVEGFAAALGADTLLTASCVWTVDEDGNYHTACDGMFIVLEGTPRENKMDFCCYCGRTLTEADGRAPDTQTEAPQP